MNPTVSGLMVQLLGKLAGEDVEAQGLVAEIAVHLNVVELDATADSQDEPVVELESE